MMEGETMETTVKQLKKGEFFTRNPIEYPTEKQVLVRGEYDRTSKRFPCHHWNDVNHEIFLRGDAKAYTDFTF